jgi:hypothetical protein
MLIAPTTAGVLLALVPKQNIDAIARMQTKIPKIKAHSRNVGPRSP